MLTKSGYFFMYVLFTPSFRNTYIRKMSKHYMKSTSASFLVEYCLCGHTFSYDSWLHVDEDGHNIFYKSFYHNCISVQEYAK